MYPAMIVMQFLPEDVSIMAAVVVAIAIVLTSKVWWESNDE